MFVSTNRINFLSRLFNFLEQKQLILIKLILLVSWTTCKTFAFNVNQLNITLENKYPLLYLNKLLTIGM